MSRKLALFFTIMALVGLLAHATHGQEAQGIVTIPSNNNVTVDVNVAKTQYAVGESITINVNTTAPNASSLYLNVVDIDANGTCTLIFPNAFSSNPVVPVGNFSLPDKSTYTFQVVPPVGTEFVQAFASLDPLDLRQVFNTGGNQPFPVLCTNPQDFAQQVQQAIQGIVAVGQIASDFTSFQVGNSSPPPPPVNQPPVTQFNTSTQFAQVGQVVQFNSTSFDPDAGDFITQQVWNFGDGGSAFGPTTFHAYFQPGVYQASLTTFDNRGGSSTATKTITVGTPAPSPTQPSGFIVNRIDNTRFEIVVNGHPNWVTPRPFTIQLETDGLFTSVNQAVTGAAAGQGISPTPVNQNTLQLTGSVGTGKVIYRIGISSNATQVKYKLRLDTNLDGIQEQSRSFVYLGAELKNPPSNPFIIQFPTGTLLPFSNATVKICLVLIDQPGIFLSICFSFNSLQ